MSKARPAKARPADGRRRARGRSAARWRPLVALAGAGAFALAAFLFLRPSSGATIAPPVPYTSPVQGNAAAPVTIVEYADFQCPSCDAFFRTVEPRLVNAYVKTGKAKLVFKNFPWIGEESRRAAEAAACAGAQGRFWEYHDLLYTDQRGENSGAFSVPRLKRFAAQLGLDQTSFDACVDGRAYEAAVAADLQEAERLGLTGTPTFVIDGQRIVGAQDYRVFAGVIDRALAGR